MMASALKTFHRILDCHIEFSDLASRLPYTALLLMAAFLRHNEDVAAVVLH